MSEGSRSFEKAVVALSIAALLGACAPAASSVATASPTIVASPSGSIASPSGSVVPTASIAPTSPPPTPTVRPVAGSAWARVTLPAAIPSGDLTDVAVDSRGWIAVGVRAQDSAPLVIVSDDGRTWREAADLHALGAARITGVASNAVGRVVVGEIADRPAALFDAGDGTWKVAKLSTTVTCCAADVAAGPDRFVAVGDDETRNPSGTPIAWMSTDGLTWRASGALPGVKTGSAELVEATPDGFLATGWTNDGAGNRAVVWASADGLAWKLAAEASADGKALTHRPPAGFAIRLLGGSGFGNATWASTDGTAWVRETVPGEGNGVFAVAGSGTGYIAIGRSSEGDQPGAIATRPSIDQPWAAVQPLPDLVDALVVRLAVAADGSLAVAVGNGTDGRPVILTSPP